MRMHLYFFTVYCEDCDKHKGIKQGEKNRLYSGTDVVLFGYICVWCKVPVGSDQSSMRYNIRIHLMSPCQQSNQCVKLIYSVTNMFPWQPPLDLTASDSCLLPVSFSSYFKLLQIVHSVWKHQLLCVRLCKCCSTVYEFECYRKQYFDSSDNRRTIFCFSWFHQISFILRKFASNERTERDEKRGNFLWTRYLLLYYVYLLMINWKWLGIPKM